MSFQTRGQVGKYSSCVSVQSLFKSKWRTVPAAFLPQHGWFFEAIFLCKESTRGVFRLMQSSLVAAVLLWASHVCSRASADLPACPLATALAPLSDYYLPCMALSLQGLQHVWQLQIRTISFGSRMSVLLWKQAIIILTKQKMLESYTIL